MKFLKSFFSNVLATMFTLMLVFFVIMLFFASLSEDVVVVQNNSVLKIDIKGEIKGYLPPNELNEAFGIDDKQITLDDIITGLDAASRDSRIKSVMLNISPVNIGVAYIEEIRNVIHKFKESGKPIVSYMEIATNKEYLLASAADSIFMPPEAILYLNKIKMELTFLKKTLEKFGIKADYLHVGKYKSAPEQYMRESASKDNKKQLVDILTQFQNISNDILNDELELDSKKLESIYSRSMLSINEAEKLGLITSIKYIDQIESDFAHNRRFKSIKLWKYKKAYPVRELDRRNQIAVIHMDGAVMPGNDGSSPVFGEVFGSSRVINNIRDAVRDKRVKGIVLRINSPGGSATASDVIWREINLAKQKKPVYASIGNMAASGGYYIAMACDSIFVQRSSIIGSIGVFMGKYDVSGLKEKFALKNETISQKNDPNIDIFSLNRSFTKKERKILQYGLDQFYTRFVSKVAEARNLSYQHADQLSQGRVWLASDERSKPLYDRVADLSEVLETMANEIEAINTPKLKLYPKEKKLFDNIEDATQSVNNVKKAFSGDMNWLTEFTRPNIWALNRWLYDIN